MRRDLVFLICEAEEYSEGKTLPLWVRGPMDLGRDGRRNEACSFIRGGKPRCPKRQVFIYDLASRLANRVQLTTDGNKVYLEAVEAAFGCDVNYAMLIMIYESTQEVTRYGPAICTGCKATTIIGNRDLKHISSSYIER